MYCQYCGAEIGEGAVICTKCGCATNHKSLATANDSGSVGWWLLGFFVPLIGLILFLVWKDTRPISAKRAGMGALVSTIVSVVLSVLSFFLIFLFLESFATEMVTDFPYSDFSTEFMQFM